MKENVRKYEAKYEGNAQISNSKFEQGILPAKVFGVSTILES
jgi:hypothetical protein